MNRTIVTLCLVGSLPLALGCTTKKEAAPVVDEPLCADFDVGASHATMKGGLRKPVRVTVLDDDDPVSTRIVLGRRTEADPPPMLSVPDEDEEYVVEWAQCENERAPRPVRADARDPSEVATYACGEAKVYAKTELKVRGGDASTRQIHFVVPPEPACWTDTVPAAPPTAEPSAVPSAAPSTEASATAAADGSASAGAAEPAAAKASPPEAPSAKPKASPTATATAAAQAP